MKPVGVVGSGKFGTTIAKLLSENVDVILLSRRATVADAINNKHHFLGMDLSTRIRCTNDPEELVSQCDLIFPVVPSSNFRSMVKDLAPFLKPHHILIQCTKGLDVGSIDLDAVQAGKMRIKPREVSTMTQVIEEETVVVRVGCLSGPNLSSEIMAGEPAATVIASRFDEVVAVGKKVLQSDIFRVYGTRDLAGAEWGGILKNCYAIASGIIFGMGYGYNLRALLITRSISEMVRLGYEMGSSKKAFFGMSGIGDMIATASVNKSRNFSVGERLGKGEKLDDILNSMSEPAEGLRTVIIARELSRHFGLHLPMIEMLFQIIYEDFDKKKALIQLMNYPYTEDVDFM
ncbi:MAG: glycerol-3-phosphate dehydrogenase (NAD(P)+) [Maribacter sp.]|jgi:glycerol-3-phosphate dehydrogenase (NAD(P)+)